MAVGRSDARDRSSSWIRSRVRPSSSPMRSRVHTWPSSRPKRRRINRRSRSSRRSSSRARSWRRNPRSRWSTPGRPHPGAGRGSRRRPETARRARWQDGSSRGAAGLGRPGGAATRPPRRPSPPVRKRPSAGVRRGGPVGSIREDEQGVEPSSIDRRWPVLSLGGSTWRRWRT